MNKACASLILFNRVCLWLGFPRTVILWIVAIVSIAPVARSQNGNGGSIIVDNRGTLFALDNSSHAPSTTNGALSMEPAGLDVRMRGQTDHLNYTDKPVVLGATLVGAALERQDSNATSYTGSDAFSPASWESTTFEDITGVNLVPVPEPSTWLAAALAFAAFSWHQRRRLQIILSFR